MLNDLTLHDYFLVMADFDDYLRAQTRVETSFQDPQGWTRRTMLNTARMGWFSSDRSVCGLRPHHLEPAGGQFWCLSPVLAANPHPLSEFDLHLINHGNHERLFEVLGCHLFDQGARFAVWAPNAQAVSVIGDFNGWAVGMRPPCASTTPAACGRASSRIWGKTSATSTPSPAQMVAVVEKGRPAGFRLRASPQYGVGLHHRCPRFAPTRLRAPHGL